VEIDHVYTCTIYLLFIRFFPFVLSSKPMWQTLKRWNRWKPVKNELSENLEQVINQDVKGDVKIFEVPNSSYKVDPYSIIQYIAQYICV